MRAFLALLKKELLLEKRTKETLAIMLFLSLLSGTILSFGMQSTFVGEENIRKLFPVLLWFVCVTTSAVSIGRSHEFELQHSAIEGVILTGVDAAYIFLAKSTSAALLIFMGEICAIAALAVLLNVSLTGILAPLLFIAALVVIGYAALATIVAGIAATSKLKAMMLPLILLPLLAPLFFAAVELTAALFSLGRLPYGSVWLSLLAGLDLLYVALGINLYQFVIKD